MSKKFSDIFSNSDINLNNPKLEEVFNKTIDMAENFGKKSAEHLEISRKKIECLDAKTKLSKLYEKYGEIQYNLLIGEEINSSENEDIVKRISKLKEKISLLTAEIEDAKANAVDTVAGVAKKTKSAFQKEFDKSNKSGATVNADNAVEVHVENEE